MKNEEHDNRRGGGLLIPLVAVAGVILIMLALQVLLPAFGFGRVEQVATEDLFDTDTDSGHVKLSGDDFWFDAPRLDVQLLTTNEYSRPGIELNEINAIVIHYTANPGTTAQQNRDYFEGLKTSGEAKVSSHFIVGLEGEIIQCIPSSEIAYASNDRNTDTLSIECCHPDETGQFNDATYKSTVHLAAWLCRAFGLTPDCVIRHYDVNGKDCPKYYVENESAWKAMLADIEEKYDEIQAEAEKN